MSEISRFVVFSPHILSNSRETKLSTSFLSYKAESSDFILFIIPVSDTFVVIEKYFCDLVQKHRHKQHQQILVGVVLERNDDTCFRSISEFYDYLVVLHIG